MQNKPLHNWTPTLYSMPLSQRNKQTVWLKMECYQPTGAYKIRGIGHLCQHVLAQGKQHFVSSSGGNAGLAVAYAGRLLGVDVTVFIPKTSKQIFVDAIKREGADVIIKGNVWDEAHHAALEYAKQKNAAYIPPFDHPLIWEGHASMIPEVADQNIKPDAVVAAVGGGGLACGVLSGMHQVGWKDVPLYTVETEGAASFAQSVAAKKLITLDSINTIATSLGARRVSQQLMDWCDKHAIIPLTVTDKSTVLACKAFADDHRALIEPSSGAALSVVYEQHPEITKHKSILVIVCGGVGISLALLQDYLDMVNT